MKTKRDIVTEAFSEIGLAEYVFDLNPEQMDGALRKLDAMMATWNAKGIKIGYPLNTQSDLDDVLNVPDGAHEAMYKNLALRIAPSFGKQIQPDTRLSAKESYGDLVNLIVQVPQVGLGSDFPLGTGNKWINNFTHCKKDNIIGNPVQEMEFVNDN